MSQPKKRARVSREHVSVDVFVHRKCALHRTQWADDDEHQESPGRVAAIEASLRSLAAIAVRDNAAPADREDLARVHSARYLDALAEATAKPETRRCLSPILRESLRGETVVDAAAGGTP